MLSKPTAPKERNAVLILSGTTDADVYKQVRVLSDVGIARVQNSDSRRVECPPMRRQQRHHIGRTSGAPRWQTRTVASSSKRRSGKDPRTGQRAHPQSALFQKPTPLNEDTSQQGPPAATITVASNKTGGTAFKRASPVGNNGRSKQWSLGHPNNAGKKTNKMELRSQRHDGNQPTSPQFHPWPRLEWQTRLNKNSLRCSRKTRAHPNKEK